MRIPFYLLTFTLVLMELGAKAQTFQKGITKALIEDFIPKGWNMILHAQGDLNKDNIDDHIVVIENTDPTNFIKNDGLGADTLNLNPRVLLVLFKTKQGYQLMVQNDKGFIPSQNSDVNECLADPLLANGGIKIVNGLIKIDLDYWLSCGSWFTNHATYTFRYQNNRFELIGFDQREFHRASGEVTVTSINFSTGKKSITTGGNMFNDDNDKPKTIWSTIRKEKLIALEDCNEDTTF